MLRTSTSFLELGVIDNPKLIRPSKFLNTAIGDAMATPDFSRYGDLTSRDTSETSPISCGVIR
jgi:hypothetical protein